VKSWLSQIKHAGIKPNNLPMFDLIVLDLAQHFALISNGFKPDKVIKTAIQFSLIPIHILQVIHHN
jgi:hypothetical protein